MMKGAGQSVAMPSMTMDELVQLQFFTDMVAIPDKVYDTLSKIHSNCVMKAYDLLTDGLNSRSLCSKRRL